MKKRRSTKYQNLSVSRKKIESIIVRGIVKFDQVQGRCFIEPPDGKPQCFSTNAQGCKLLGRQFGVEAVFEPGKSCP